jgi:hypothetical protein
MSSFLKQSCQESIGDGTAIPVDGARFKKPYLRFAESSARGESRMVIIQKKPRIKSALTVMGEVQFVRAL